MAPLRKVTAWYQGVTAQAMALIRYLTLCERLTPGEVGDAYGHRIKNTHPVVLALPDVAFGRELCGKYRQALRHSAGDLVLVGFKAGDIQTKRLILIIVGSNLSLMNKKLSIDAKKPFRRWSEPTTLQTGLAFVEDVRTWATRTVSATSPQVPE